MTVKIFEPAYADQWNQFISSGKNSSFLFDRNFMEYHADRFSDHSLMIFNDEGLLVAVIPANITAENILYSHQGLTYGAFVLRNEEKLIPTIEIVYYALKFMHEKGISTFRLKNIPSFYDPCNSDELEYILFLLQAELYRRDTAMVVDKNRKIPYKGNLRREARNAEKMHASILEEKGFEQFWNEILVPNLKDRFGVAPVHSVEEIELLHSRFPGNIRQFNVYLDDTIVAGTTLFITPWVVHCQYISANETGRKTGCLNYLFKHLIDHAFNDYRYFDFGIVNEEEGTKINTGMLFWKEAFGARAHKHDFYQVQTSAYTVLEKFLN